MTTSTPAGWYPNPDNPKQLRLWDGQQWTDQVQASISEQPDAAIGQGPARYSGPPILVVTTNDLPGYRITQVHGEVFGITVRARNAFSNMGAGFRTMFGGEVKGYTQLLSDSRLEAVERLRYATVQVGGNAVVGMRFDTGEIADMMNEVAAYGTAVTVERIAG
ncbi:MAG: heavy metal-binding domain-containing protein [Frankiales bacterium]|nr:heavy metal-binding domain-containing protein [Frankiales bacterium]